MANLRQNKKYRGVVVLGEYLSPSPSYENGDVATLQTDNNGNLKTTLATKIAGEDIVLDVLKTEQRFSFHRTTTSGLVKSGSGFLHTVTFSATGTVVSGVITLYNNTTDSGQIIWSGVIPAGIAPLSIILDVSFSSGLYIKYDGVVSNVGTVVSFR